MTDLGAFMVAEINDNGKIIGYSGADAFIWVNGTITILADFIHLFFCTICYQ
jgi:hypothetical protein